MVNSKSFANKVFKECLVPTEAKCDRQMNRPDIWRDKILSDPYADPYAMSRFTSLAPQNLIIVSITPVVFQYI